jgi:hypothetical protein
METEMVKEMEKRFFPNPLQLTLGDGCVAISAYSSPEGHGVLFQECKEPHEIGSPLEDLAELHDPQSDELYITCKSKASALVLLKQVQRMVDCFESEEGGDG